MLLDTILHLGFLSGLAKKLVDTSGDPSNREEAPVAHRTSACPLLQKNLETLSA